MRLRILSAALGVLAAGLGVAAATGLAAQETTSSKATTTTSKTTTVTAPAKPASPTPPAVATPPPATSAPAAAVAEPSINATPLSVDTPEPKPSAPAAAAAVPKAPEPPKPPPEPLKRPRFNAAILQGVDKITAETLRFEAKVGEPVRYKGLILTVRACETTAADETITDSVAYTEVQSQPEVLPGRVAAPPRQVFRGWMFASSPTLHPFEHPVYDLWLIACKTEGPGA